MATKGNNSRSVVTGVFRSPDNGDDVFASSFRGCDVILRTIGRIKMKSVLRWYRQWICSHRFDYADLIPRREQDGNVAWPCWKCGRVFRDQCGLDVLRHGVVEKKPIVRLHL